MVTTEDLKMDIISKYNSYRKTWNGITIQTQRKARKEKKHTEQAEKTEVT